MDSRRITGIPCSKPSWTISVRLATSSLRTVRCHRRVRHDQVGLLVPVILSSAVFGVRRLTRRRLEYTRRHVSVLKVYVGRKVGDGVYFSTVDVCKTYLLFPFTKIRYERPSPLLQQGRMTLRKSSNRRSSVHFHS